MCLNFRLGFFLSLSRISISTSLLRLRWCTRLARLFVNVVDNLTSITSNIDIRFLLLFFFLLFSSIGLRIRCHLLILVHYFIRHSVYLLCVPLSFPSLCFGRVVCHLTSLPSFSPLPVSTPRAVHSLLAFFVQPLSHVSSVQFTLAFYLTLLSTHPLS